MRLGRSWVKRGAAWALALGMAAFGAAPALAQGAAPAAKPAARHAAAPAQNKAAPQRARFDATDCYDCHEKIKEFHKGNGHETVGCDACHGGLDTHSPKGKGRPTTKVDSASCGSCHANQYRTMYTANNNKTASREKRLAGGPSPSPAFDKLLMPHGFTKEHNEPRSHAFALYDQVVVDRAFGGRFVDKLGLEGLAREGGDIRIWDVLVDQYPGQPHQAFKPGTAAAANPVCMSCKSADHILDWAYLGDPKPEAKWSRLSKVNEFVQSVNTSLNCIFCHDPHAAKPRIVRDALIQALTRPEKDTLWHKDPKATPIDVKELGERGFVRKIALLPKYDAKLQCGQCHVEYNCNPGTDLGTGQPITMSDQRTNHFPFKNVMDVGQHYTDLKFRDFKHGITGALLWKAQHPDTETYYNSVHDQQGIDCAGCHMPKVKDPKTGKTWTSHWQTSPKNYLKETCLNCHKTWNEQQANYVIDSMKNRYQGKLRQAEFWLTRFVDKFEEAQNLGVPKDVLDDARKKHYDAHVHWEWWTASNGSYFHNPQLAQDSINKGMAISQAGVKQLDEAMAARRGGGKAPGSAGPVVPVTPAEAAASGPPGGK